MEKDFVSPRMTDLPPSDRFPRMEHTPDAGQSDGLQGNGDHNGCGCGRPYPVPADRCMGYEGCGPDSWGLCEYPLAMVYAPCQVFRGLYDPQNALSRGTLFSELDLPLGREGCGLTVTACPCRGERRPT